MKFRRSYIAGPLILAVLCLITALLFVFQSPNPIAVRFDSQGAATTTMSKFVFVALIMLSQAIGIFIAAAIAQSVIRIGRNLLKTGPPPAELGGFIILMSHMVLLPQVIIAYLMLDVFIYALWERHLISALLFSLIVILASIVVFGIVFVRQFMKINSILNR